MKIDYFFVTSGFHFWLHNDMLHTRRALSFSIECTFHSTHMDGTTSFAPF